MTQVYPEIIDRFKRLMGAHRLAHAYLFTGPEGVGKVTMALKIAQLSIVRMRKARPVVIVHRAGRLSLGIIQTFTS